jgi:glutamate-5-semialdehyde dehydrogenase
VAELLPENTVVKEDSIWYEEFLAMKCVVGAVVDLEEAVQKINNFSGGHSATIMTRNKQLAMEFMDQVDSAAVYHNASTRFTDGGQMGVGAELAISTDKLHHRGPLGLEQLVTNKYYVYGDGQVRMS